MSGVPITVIVAGEPAAKGRPRMTRRGIAYTPAATRKYEAHARLAAQLAMDGRPPIATPVRLDLVAELPVPRSWSKGKAAEAIGGDVRPTSRPDIDNYAKEMLDVLNGIVIGDDSQVVELSASKKFGIAPKLVATVTPLDAAPSNRVRRALVGALGYEPAGFESVDASEPSVGTFASQRESAATLTVSGGDQ
jgi:Holliday junction resolvase RusA-like endonuclease